MRCVNRGNSAVRSSGGGPLCPDGPRSDPITGTTPINSPPVASPRIEHFDASDGYRYALRHWHSTTAFPRARIVQLHGIQSHSGWYEFSGGWLAVQGCEIFALDRRGSGMNEPHRGHAPHVDRLINDVTQFLDAVRGRHDPSTDHHAPLILTGLSWGGKLATAVAMRRPELIDGLALLYPGICAQISAAWHRRLQLRIAVALGLWHRTAPIPLDDPALFTDVPRWQEFIRDDPLALREATVGFFEANRRLDLLAANAPEQIQCPTLMMLAGQDRIIDNTASRRWWRRLDPSRRTLHEYPDATHTLEFDPGREAIFSDLLRWIDSIRPQGKSEQSNAGKTVGG